MSKDGSKAAYGRRGYLQEGSWDAIHVIEVESLRQLLRWWNPRIMRGSVCLTPFIFLLKVFCHTFLYRDATLNVSCRLAQRRKE